MTESGSGSSGTYFRIALKKDPLGKGRRLTDSLSDTDPDLLYFADTAMPAIAAMLGDAGAPAENAQRESAAVMPAVTVAYTHMGDRYVRKFRIRSALVLAGALALGIHGIAASNSGTLLFGAGLLVFCLVLIDTITLDTAGRNVLVGRAFGFWTKSYPMARFAGIGTTRTYHNGIYGGTQVTMELDDPDEKVALMTAYFTKGLVPFADETNAIIGTTMARQDDPAA